MPRFTRKHYTRDTNIRAARNRKQPDLFADAKPGDKVLLLKLCTQGFGEVDKSFLVAEKIQAADSLYVTVNGNIYHTAHGLSAIGAKTYVIPYEENKDQTAEYKAFINR